MGTNGDAAATPVVLSDAQNMQAVIENRNTHFDEWKTQLDSDYAAYKELMPFSPLVVTILNDNSAKFSTDGSDAKAAYDSINSAIQSNLYDNMVTTFFVNFETDSEYTTPDTGCKAKKEEEMEYSQTYG